MRNALEVVMRKVPIEHSTSTVKVYLAECILKAAAHGLTSEHKLVAVAANQIKVAISLFPPLDTKRAKKPRSEVIPGLLVAGVRG
jgi:hypothetical protein